MLRASAGALVGCRALEQQRRQREASVLDYIFTGRKRIAASVVFDRYTATARQLMASLAAGRQHTVRHHP